MAEPACDTVRRRLGKGFDEADHPRDAGGRWTAGEHALDHAANLPPHDARKAEAIDVRLDQHLGGIHDARKRVAQHVATLKEVHKDLTAGHKGAQKALADLNDLLEKHGYEQIAEEEVDDIDEAAGLRARLSDMFSETRSYLTPSKLQDHEATGANTHGGTTDPIAALEAALRAHSDT
ncbi:hypothetical protein [Methylobacterium brachiatum]|uniref:hypothetical protein n=1 Tax=Methylobacterium brachiatum TaxID=269660 RepID=UPI000EFC8472|nr:hypothetical protein [Methylobacterium brachiatum]AYO81591.1 hypothetical protein EBB05_04415 [Methylobacterium brachiatum]